MGVGREASPTSSRNRKLVQRTPEILSDSLDWPIMQANNIAGIDSISCSEDAGRRGEV